MKNRFGKMSKSLLYAMCFFCVCGVSYSCSDDYDLDETSPSFLGASIYDELKARGDFNYTIKLIDDLSYAEVLSKTGSKTLFVAKDDAYDAFFKTTSWKDASGNPIRSYDQLSTSQKRLLLNNAMLDNAYVLEMLTNITLSGSLSKNQGLRQITSASVTDTVRYWKYYELPQSVSAGSSSDTLSDVSWWGGDFWAAHNTQAAGGMYMAVDATNPMMTHFLEGQLSEKNITHDDIMFILGQPAGSWGTESRSYIYNRRITEADVTCMNGYFHVLDSVLVQPDNMAITIANEPTTSIFSAMLDRFSAPYYHSTLTANYKALHNIGSDSVFVKIYAASNSAVGKITTDPNANQLKASFPYLTFDPGWNQYAVSSTTTKEQDMGVMFVPTNAAMLKFFTEDNSGKILMERYAPGVTVTSDNLLECLYKVPLDLMQSLINNMMKASFNATVPSKYRTIMNDAQDPMFQRYDEASYKQLINKVLLANNGVVYLTNAVMPPADYTSVIAPALYNNSARIMRSLIKADEAYIQGTDYANAPLKKYYSTYLKAMQAQFSFFIPTDSSFYNYGYVDPFTYNIDGTGKKRVWSFLPVTSTASSSVATIDVAALGYIFDPSLPRTRENYVANTPQSQIKTNNQNQSVNSGWGAVKKALLTEMVDHHIVVHDQAGDNVMSGQKFYVSRSGAPVYVQKQVATNNGKSMELLGGYQVMVNKDSYSDNDEVCTVEQGYDLTDQTDRDGNGWAYLLDRPMQASMYSVYNNMRTMSDCSDFFALCAEKADADIDTLLVHAGFRDSIKATKTMTVKAQFDLLAAKYKVFRRYGTSFYTSNPSDRLVRFFNNYNYTVYVPNNTAMQQAYAAGLKTWDDIETFIANNITNVADEQLVYTNKLKAQAMITTLVSFLKYHFQDQSVFVDNLTDTKECQTACIDNTTGIYVPLTVQQTSGAISLTDNAGRTVAVNTGTLFGTYNILARDIEFSNATTSADTQGYVKTSSYAVMHELDGYLNFESDGDWNANGRRFDQVWSSAAKAKAFTKKYQAIIK